MVEWMLSDVIGQEFAKSVGKGQHETGKAMHVGFRVTPTVESDQYETIHMYLYAPLNYVYVAIQTERIDGYGDRRIGDMEILACHDSCWWSAVQDFVFKNRDRLNGFSGFKLDTWFDVIELNQQEKDFLQELEHWKYDGNTAKKPFPNHANNPFNNRGIWAGKE